MRNLSGSEINGKIAKFRQNQEVYFIDYVVVYLSLWLTAFIHLTVGEMWGGRPTVIHL